MNALQRTEFQLLRVFADVCVRLGLKYYAVCGTALGAVKYGGFIPWDDDIDVAMCREDYEVFMREAPALLPDGIFLQNYISDPGYPNIFAKLRDSRTTFIEKSYEHLPINHGIYIDIFPIDGYPSGKFAQKRLEWHKTLFRIKQLTAFDSEPGSKVKMLKKLYMIIGVHKRLDKVIRRFERRVSKYSCESSEIWCNHGNWQGKLEYAPREQYGNGVKVSFEGYTVRVPERYDEYLRQKYGDWRSELPECDREGHHYYLVLDPDKSYTEYRDIIT